MRFLDRNGYIIETPPNFDASEAVNVALVKASDVVTPAQIEHMKIRHESVSLLKLTFPDANELFLEIQVRPLYKFSGFDVKKSDIKVISKITNPMPNTKEYGSVV